MDDLSLEMQGFQQEFQGALSETAGFFYPYVSLSPSPGVVFQGSVWPADPRSRAYAHAVTTVPELAQADVRFLTVAPGQEAPGEGARIPFDGGTLTLHFWGQIDPLSGESIGACSWVAG